jgi:hypothetical protein
MFVACLLAASLMQALPARADDYTDIWWAGPAEDGWGVNLIQSQDFIFATFFIYGPAPAKTPIWYVGQLARVGSVFTGGLFQTTGTGFNAPWNPADHTTVQVGTATFNPIDSSSATLNYSVNGVAVAKAIVRQTLTPILIGGTYYGTAVVVHSGCDTASNNGTVLTDFDPVVAQTTGNQLQFDFLYAGTENCARRAPTAGRVAVSCSDRVVCLHERLDDNRQHDGNHLRNESDVDRSRRPLARDERRRRMRRRRQVRDRVSLKLSQHATFAGARIRTGRPPPPRRR